MRTKPARFATFLVAFALVGAAMASQAAAKGTAPGCGPFSSTADGAADGPLLKVTRKHSKAKPLTVEVVHSAGAAPAPDDQFVNIQIATRSNFLWIREEFPSPQDLDLYLYDSSGERAAYSAAVNLLPVPGLLDAGGRGGMDHESIVDHPVEPCSAWTIKSSTYLSPGTTATLKIWAE